MEEWLYYLNQLLPMPSELTVSIMGAMRKDVYRKNKTILSSGHPCDWIGYVEKGLIKASIEPPDMGDRVFQYYPAGHILFIVNSFVHNQPSRISLMAAEESVIRKINRVEINALCEKYPVFYYHLYRMIDHQYTMLADHFMLYILSPRERFARFYKEQNWFLQYPEMKNYMIADYLGMDRATFSRYRHGKS